MVAEVVVLGHGADEATSLLSREEALLARTRTCHVVGAVAAQTVDGTANTNEMSIATRKMMASRLVLIAFL
jgi:hypothetical protein